MSTVLHSAGQSRIFIRCPASREMRQMSRIFRKWYYYFLSLPIMLHFCLATQQSDELRIKIGSKFAHQQTSYRSVRQTPSISHAADANNLFIFLTRPRPPAASTLLSTIVFTDRLRKSIQRDVLTIYFGGLWSVRV